MGEILAVGAEAGKVEAGKKVLFSDINAYEVQLARFMEPHLVPWVHMQQYNQGFHLPRCSAVHLMVMVWGQRCINIEAWKPFLLHPLLTFLFIKELLERHWSMTEAFYILQQMQIIQFRMDAPFKARMHSRYGHWDAFPIAVAFLLTFRSELVSYNNESIAAITLGMTTNDVYIEPPQEVPKWHGPSPESREMVISLEWGNFKSQQSQQKGTGQGRLFIRPGLQYWVSNFRATFKEDKGRNYKVYSLSIYVDIYFD